MKIFVQGCIDNIRRRSVRVTPAITDHAILRLTNVTTGTVAHQGLIAIQPARLALDVMDELRRTPLHGHGVKVFRYRHSSFETTSTSETKSMSDLLGGTPANGFGDAPRFRIELVTTTGSTAATPPRSAEKSSVNQGPETGTPGICV
ncbi:MAG: hypothetical protein WBG92_24620 [Thiohalocapsa sp.]